MTICIEIKKQFGNRQPPIAPDIDRESETWEETCVFWGKTWDELSLEDFKGNQFSLISFDAKSFVYFFGAFMFLMLERGPQEVTALDMLLVNYSDLDVETLVEISDDELDMFDTSPVDDFISEISKNLTASQIDLMEEFFAFCRDKVSSDTFEASRLFTRDLRNYIQ